MKNTRTSMYLMLMVALLASSGSSVLNATYADNDCCQRTSCEPVYDCGCPINCGSVNVWLRAGVAPMSWRDRGDFSAVSCNSLATTFGKNIVPLLSPLPQFNKLFHLPWIAGGQIGYAVTDCFEFYVEFNYRSASRRTFTTPAPVAIVNDTVNITLTFANNYRVFDAYVGGRFYWGRYWCDQLAFFLGAKYGLVSHKSVCFNYAINSVSCTSSTPLASTANTPFFFRNTRPAAGINAGLDWCLGCGWSFMIMGEVVASCGPTTNGNGNLVIASNCTLLPSILPSNLIVGGTGTELYFPVTFGFKYSF